MITFSHKIEKYFSKDYSYLLEDKKLLLNYLDKLKRLAGKKKVDEWSEMVQKERNEDLVRDLVNDYYDKCYRKPRGEALQVFHVPDGVITDASPETLVNSNLVHEITKLGSTYINHSSS